MARWITKNGRHIKINNYRRRHTRPSYPNYSYEEEQRFQIQQQLDELKFRKELEMAKNAVSEGVSFVISHIIPMIGPIIGDIIKLAKLERENKEGEEQIRLIDSIKKGVDTILASRAQYPQHKEKAVLIKEAYQDTFVRTYLPNRSRRFIRALISPTAKNVIKSEFQTQSGFVEINGFRARLTESNVEYQADIEAAHVF